MSLVSALFSRKTVYFHTLGGLYPFLHSLSFNNNNEEYARKQRVVLVVQL